MFRSNPKQKSNLLLSAILTTISFSIAMLLLRYFRRGQFYLVESLVGALIFFVVYYFIGSYLNKRIERKKQKREERNYDQK